MAQREKSALRSQRLRRAVTCMKRKERGGGGDEEESGEEDSESPSKPKRGKTASRNSDGKPDGGRTVAGGGFLGSETTAEPLVEVGCSGPASRSGSRPQSAVTPPQRAGKSSNSSSSSSSGDDSDGGREVAMVTARSVFEIGRRDCRGKNARGRGTGRGRAKRS